MVRGGGSRYKPRGRVPESRRLLGQHHAQDQRAQSAIQFGSRIGRARIQGALRHGRALDARQLARESRSSRFRSIRIGRRWPRSRSSSRPFRRWFLPARRATSRRRSPASCGGEAFLLQGGDCAESFAEHGANNIRDFFRVFLQMAVVLTFAARAAGGQGRPHRRPVRQAALLADREARRHRAAELSRRHHQRQRLHRGSAHAPIRAGRSRPIASRPRRSTCCAPSRRAATPISAACTSGCSASSRTRRQSRRYTELADRISETLGFMRAIGLDLERPSGAAHHRHLHQPRGAAARLRAGDDAGRFDERRLVRTSGHMVWIGDRTRQLDHAHVEYCRGIKNPLGLKCGPSSKPDDLLRLIDVLNPDNEPGRLTLICRHRLRQGRRPAAAADPRREAREARGGVVVRPDARQHHHVGVAATRRGRSTASSPR